MAWELSGCVMLLCAVAHLQKVPLARQQRLCALIEICLHGAVLSRKAAGWLVGQHVHLALHVPCTAQISIQDLTGESLLLKSPHLPAACGVMLTCPARSA